LNHLFQKDLLDLEGQLDQLILTLQDLLHLWDQLIQGYLWDLADLWDPMDHLDQLLLAQWKQDLWDQLILCLLDQLLQLLL
jgi:hypothetical protein